MNRQRRLEVVSWCNPVCADARHFQSFRVSGGALKLGSGYFFLVSPDEQWVAAIARYIPAPRLTVMHFATGRTWDAEVPRDEPINSPPPGFSRDGDELYVGSRVVRLSPEMAALSFQAYAGASSPRYSLLVPQGSSAPDELESMEFAARQEFAARAALNAGRRPGREALPRIDFSRVGAAESRRIRNLDRVMRAEYGFVKTVVMKATVRVLLGSRGRRQGYTPLHNLAVSPDGRYVAGFTSIPYSDGRPSEYGVIIPLQRDRLVAWPFAVAEDSGRLLWSRSSREIYFMDGAGDPTIYRLSVEGVFEAPPS